VLTLNDVKTTNPGTDVDADALRIFWSDFESGLFKGLTRGGNGKVDEARHLARVLLLNELERVKVLYFGGEVDWKLRCVKASDGGHAALASEQVLPGFSCCIPNRTKQADTGDNDSSGTARWQITYPPSRSSRCIPPRP
jgi:hypothetical protein